MDRTACPPQLLARAKRFAPDVEIIDLEDGFVDVYWLRSHGKLQSLWRVRDISATLAVKEMIALESERARKFAHGEECTCEDCVIDRLDRARELARRPRL
jgi:hypothetical protein